MASASMRCIEWHCVCIIGMSNSAPTSYRTLCCNTVQGRLLQLRLPCEVRPDSSKAERSTASGHLLVTMPKEDAASSAGLLAHAR